MLYKLVVSLFLKGVVKTVLAKGAENPVTLLAKSVAESALHVGQHRLDTWQSQ